MTAVGARPHPEVMDLWALELDVLDAVGEVITIEQTRDLIAAAVMRAVELRLAGGELAGRPSRARVRAWMTPHGDWVCRR